MSLCGKRGITASPDTNSIIRNKLYDYSPINDTTS